MKNMKRCLWLGALFLALVVLGCNRASGPSDSQVATDVQNKIYSDSNIPDKQITINSNKGVVTLSGSVSSDAVRAAAGMPSLEFYELKHRALQWMVDPLDDGGLGSSRRARWAGNGHRRRRGDPEAVFEGLEQLGQLEDGHAGDRVEDLVF